jgi:hypothetical protein
LHIQNQIGHYPLKWDKTGVIIEVHQFDQYAVNVDGSARTTLRNRKFLRKYVPVKSLKTAKPIASGGNLLVCSDKRSPLLGHLGFPSRYCGESIFLVESE